MTDTAGSTNCGVIFSSSWFTPTPARAATSVYSSVVSSSLNGGRRQNDVSRKLNPVISCRTVASIVLWHCCILRLRGLMWVGRQTAGERELWKSVFQGHLLVKLGAGERSEQPVSPSPGEGLQCSALCAADVWRCSQAHFDGNFLSLI